MKRFYRPKTQPQENLLQHSIKMVADMVIDPSINPTQPIE
jgi:hypothetical protein